MTNHTMHGRRLATGILLIPALLGAQAAPQGGAKPKEPKPYNPPPMFTDAKPIEFTLVDYGEPGSADRAALRIYQTSNPRTSCSTCPCRFSQEATCRRITTSPTTEPKLTAEACNALPPPPPASDVCYARSRHRIRPFGRLSVRPP